MVKTMNQKRWRRNTVEVKCAYCGSPFMQQTPWQRFCCDSHKTMALREKKS